MPHRPDPPTLRESEPTAEPTASQVRIPTTGTLGVFDSGVGGFSVLRHLLTEIPSANTLYFADQAHIPYGPRPPSEVQRYAEAITRFLHTNGAELIVVACNAASAAALDTLRATFPDMPFVGMEPAVKPAAQTTRSGRVGVLATPGTFNSHRYANLMARYGNGIQVYEDPCEGLVQLIEAGAVAEPATHALLTRCVTPMLEAGVDTLVLGCTHYPFIIPALRSIVGEDVAIIDPAPAVARRAQNVLQQNGLLPPPHQNGTLRCYTSGSAEAFHTVSRQLLGQACETRQVRWRHDGRITES